MQQVRNKKFKKYRINRFYRSQIDIYGGVLRIRRLRKSFRYFYFKFFRKLFRRTWNIFLKLDNKPRVRYFAKTRTKSVNANMYYRKSAVFKFYQNIKHRGMYLLYLKSKKINKFSRDSFIDLLERRVDMLLFRAYNSMSLGFIRQFIQHKGILVNNHKTYSCNFIVNLGDFIYFDKKDLGYIHAYLWHRAIHKRRYFVLHKFPSYMEVNYKVLIIKLYRFITLKEVPFYSRNFGGIINGLFK